MKKILEDFATDFAQWTNTFRNSAEDTRRRYVEHIKWLDGEIAKLNIELANRKSFTKHKSEVSERHWELF